MDLIRPWNEARPNLGDKALSPAEKSYIGKVAMEREKTLESVAQFFRISIHSVNKQKNLVKKGHKIKEKTGRPKCFDADSFASIETQIDEIGQNS